MGRILIILNPCSGQRRANRYLPEIIQIVNAAGYECTVFVTTKHGDAEDYAAEHAGKFDRIICIGGDGTLHETVAGLVKGGVQCSVGYIPSGTTNDYASSIGMHPDILEAAKDAVEGDIHSFDIGLFNGDSFIYTATCGVFARASYSTPQNIKNVLGYPAYILEGIKDLPTYKPMHMRVEANDRVYEDDYLLCAVSNSTSVGGVLKLDETRVSLNDGKFEVMLVKNPQSAANWGRILVGLAKAEIPNEMIEFFTAEKMNIHTEDTVEWTFDGEKGIAGQDFEIVNLHSRMQLVLPVNPVKEIDTLLRANDDEEDELQS